MKTPIILTLITFLTLAACTSPGGGETPTPTIVRLDRSALTPTASLAVVDLPPTATPIPFPSPTSTPTPFSITTPTPSTASSEPTPTLEAVAPRVEIIAAGLNVRQGPGINYPAIGAVSKGEIFDIAGLSPNRNWLQITTTKGISGWISAQPPYTQILGSLEDVPVVEIQSSGPLSPGSSQPAAVEATSGGQIVFMTGSGGDLYVIDATGTHLRHLASGVIDPVVSPDGQQVAFTRWDGSKLGALYVMNLDGSGERAVAGDIRQPKSPTWSPDGQEIIISFQHGGTVDPPSECREFDSDDGFQLPNIGEITGIHRNADGSVRICFIRLADLQWSLRRVNLANGHSEDLPADLYSFNPSWDPQNPWRIIYDGQRGLMQLDLDSGTLSPFTDDVRDTAPVFSPAGQKLALTYKQHDHWEVYTYDLATGSRQRLTKPPLLANPQYNSAAPAWSPDGSQLAFVTDRSGRWEIWVMNADGSNQRPLFAPEVQAQLELEYRGVNERMLNWVR